MHKKGLVLLPFWMFNILIYSEKEWEIAVFIGIFDKKRKLLKKQPQKRKKDLTNQKFCAKMFLCE